MKALALLDYVKSILRGDRHRTHGDHEECFSLIALGWTTYIQKKKKTKVKFTKEDVAMMMILLKVVRQTIGEGSIDNFADICGYSAFAGEFIQKDKESFH